MDRELSKFISLILRHKPEVINITLDEHGWADVEKLIKGINKCGKRIDLQVLERIVKEDGKLDYETTVKVGSRHGKPVILKVNTRAMVQAGYKFYLSENNVWLTNKIEPEYIEVTEGKG